MKKALSLILALMLCLSLYACGESEVSEEDVRNTIIQNTWVGTENGTEYTVRFLTNDEAWIECVYNTHFEYTWGGPFGITEDQIIINDTLNEVNIFIDYTMEDDTLSLTLYDPLDQAPVRLSKGSKGVF